MKDLRREEQPRERLEWVGADSLTDAELLAILLRTGTSRMNVVETSRHLIDHFDGLRNLMKQEWQSLMVIPGIAKVKALTLKAAFELARRAEAAQIGEQVHICSPDDAAAYFRPRLRDLMHEEFHVMHLNHAKVVTGCRKISMGNSHSTVVDIPEVIRSALIGGAASIIVAHNHPSGTAKESTADVQLTKRIREACRLVGIDLDDHIIITGDTFVSMRSKNLV
ncbi:MAG: DNA repair protein RadC [Balneolaceae bacterium]|nr:DNA repair protein RadC [Balneolaceae bacterium]